MEKLRDSVINQLSEMDSFYLVEVHNIYCDLINSHDSIIYPNDEEHINRLVGDCPYNAIQRAFYGDYNPNHHYVRLDGYGNLESFDDPADYVYISEMVDTIMENIDEFEYFFDLTKEDAKTIKNFVDEK